jgi:hypothetical protein
MGRVCHRRIMKEPPTERIVRAVSRPTKFASWNSIPAVFRPIEMDGVVALNNVTVCFVSGAAV